MAFTEPVFGHKLGGFGQKRSLFRKISLNCPRYLENIIEQVFLQRRHNSPKIAQNGGLRLFQRRPQVLFSQKKLT